MSAGASHGGASPPVAAEHPGVHFRFFAELKRRNIVRVAVLYLSFCWVVLDPVHVVFHMLEAPPWANHLVLLLMAAGLPAVLVFTWLFELTPSGLKPTVLVDPAQSIRARTGRRIDRAIIVVLTLALGYLLVDKFSLVRREAEPLAAPARPSAPAPVAAASSLPLVPPAPSVAAAAPARATAAVEPGAVVTILDGTVLFIRGASRFTAAEGVRLADGDIVTTGDGSFVQLEFEDGTRADLGPATDLMLPSAEAGPRSRRVAYLRAGWVKVTAPAGSAGSFELLRAARFELGAADNVTVSRVDAGEDSVFVESGRTLLLERARGSSSAERALKAGQFYLRHAPQAGAVSNRPSSQFLQQMPASFRDTLPRRLGAFRSRAVAARLAPDFSYADVEPWLKSDRPIRRQLVERWKDKALDPAFRRALEANLRDLPEWAPILHPPGEEPDAAPPVPARAQPAASSPSS